MKTRIYLITRIAPLEGDQTLIEASSIAQATAQIAAKLFTVRAIGALEAVAAMNGGAKVEKAGDQAGPSADTGAYLPAVKAGE